MVNPSKTNLINYINTHYLINVLNKLLNPGINNSINDLCFVKVIIIKFLIKHMIDYIRKNGIYYDYDGHR